MSLGSGQVGIHAEPGFLLDGMQMAAHDPLGPGGLFWKAVVVVAGVGWGSDMLPCRLVLR